MLDRSPIFMDWHKGRSTTMDKSRAMLTVALTLTAAAWTVSANSAQAQQVCGDEVKAEVAKILSQYEPDSKESLTVQQELYKKYEYCLKDANDEEAARRLRERACGKVPFVGSLSWEIMPCCGYDPQERTFACPIEIHRHNGYGAPQFPGSHEHVLVCVDYGAGLVPVARDWVHLADDISGTQPVWNFAALPKTFDRKFLSLQDTSVALPARAILAWELAPQACEQTPIWGHAVDFQIRLDP